MHKYDEKQASLERIKQHLTGRLSLLKSDEEERLACALSEKEAAYEAEVEKKSTKAQKQMGEIMANLKMARERISNEKETARREDIELLEKRLEDDKKISEYQEQKLVLKKEDAKKLAETYLEQML
ncbi:unnamed protein product [Protopolystoma xenopodis]|uniref:Uncharacterized protein n=1 Tax=Protopolystoma xenopodis TaxID=117903 RepID=A0A3S5BUK8_9PLAT|nr:unnamed protein product [Protopolystoma xenopodis]